MDSYDALTTSIAVGSLAVYYIIMLAIIVLMIIAQWKIFTKAGKPGWASIIPFYNTYCLFDIAWGNGWLFLLTFIPCIGIIFQYIAFFKLGKAFGQGTGFGIGLILLNPIFMLILGFGKAEYAGSR